MTSIRDDRDLERLLRATLSARADTVDRGPQPDRGTQPSRRPPRRPQGWLPLLAAAAVIVTVAAIVVAIRAAGDGGHAPPAHSQSVKPLLTTSPSATATTSPAPRVRTTGSATILRWPFGITAPTGYQLRDRTVTATYAALILRKLHDPGTFTGVNGGAGKGTIVMRYERGAYDASAVTAGTRVTVNGHRGYYASAPVAEYTPSVPSGESGSAPTIAWQYAPDSWITVWGQTPATQVQSQLLLVANAVRPDLATPVALPIQLPSLPAGLHVLGADEDLINSYGLHVYLTDRTRVMRDATSSIDIQVLRNSSLSFAPARHSVVGGRSGYVDPSGQEFEVRLGKRAVLLSFDGARATGAVLHRELDGLVWSPDPTKHSTWFAGATLVP